MPRDSQIPLFLWIATAILVHLMWGGGAEHAADQIEETLDIGRFARSVRQHVRVSTQTLEVALLNDPERAPQESEPVKEEAESDAPEPEEEPEEDVAPAEPAHEKVPPVPPKPVTPPPEQEKKEAKKEEEKEKEKQKEEEKKEEEKDIQPELPKYTPRVAVRQHVEDKNQEDNPNAQFLGEHANRVKEQTQARITSTEENSERPTPGGHHQGPDSTPGNSSEDRVAQLEDREGDPDRPPSETSDSQDSSKPAPVAAAPAPRAGVQQPIEQRSAIQPQAAQKAQAAIEAQEAVPSTLTLPGGSFEISPQQKAVQGQRGRRARQFQRGRRQRNDPTQLLGLGAQGLTDSGVNLNLTPSTAVAVIGPKQLQAERARDGERRRSEHRGSWKETSFEKYRSSIENYVAGVKPGNQTALNTAHAPFANYLNAIHQRLHPMFAGRFLASLDRMADDHPLNDMEMITKLEIVLSPADGRVVRMGVTKASGVTAFDIGALDSVRQASPFGAAPESIISPDGNVYLHWGFYRNPIYACSTYNAHPYKLKTAPKSAPPKPGPPPAKPYEGEEAPPGRHGKLQFDNSTTSEVRTARR